MKEGVVIRESCFLWCAGRRRNRSPYVWVSFAWTSRRWCRITLPFPSTNSTHVESTRKPPSQKVREKKGGKKTGVCASVAHSSHLRRDDTRQLSSSLVSLMASSSTSPFLTFPSLAVLATVYTWKCRPMMYSPIPERSSTLLFFLRGRWAQPEIRCLDRSARIIYKWFCSSFIFGDLLFPSLLLGCSEVQYSKLSQHIAEHGSNDELREKEILFRPRSIILFYYAYAYKGKYTSRLKDWNGYFIILSR